MSHFCLKSFFSKMRFVALLSHFPPPDTPTSGNGRMKTGLSGSCPTFVSLFPEVVSLSSDVPPGFVECSRSRIAFRTSEKSACILCRSAFYTFELFSVFVFGFRLGALSPHFLSFLLLTAHYYPIILLTSPLVLSTC